MKKILEKDSYLILVIITAFFFYIFNLRYTYFFSGDMARDTLASLRVLKNKEITAIGPPLSFGQYGTRQIYFSSLTYYMGALGLFLFHKDVLGPVYINIFLMMIGIYYFYRLTRLFFDQKKSLLATAIFSLSPVVVAHLRFFWNPNFVISISPIYWYYYFLALKDNRKINYFLSGFLAGLLFHFHYFVIFTIGISLIFLFKKNLKNSLFFILSFVLSILPLILFEIKNHFYLTNALIYNTTINRKFVTVFQPILARTIPIKLVDIFLIPVMILGGFETEAAYFNSIVNLTYWQKVISGFFITLIIGFHNRKKLKNNSKKSSITELKILLIIVIFSTIISSLLSHEVYYLRYFFISIPLFVILITNLVDKKVSILLITLYFLTNKNILYSQNAHQGILNEKSTTYPSISHIEKAIKIIKTTDFDIPYNITENFVGDARALYLRFYIERDPNLPPISDEFSYQNLKTLFVFAPDLKTIYKENRWEFLATPNLKLVKTWEIDKHKYLFKFENQSSL